MGFEHAAAPYKVRTNTQLSADNAKPDRFSLMGVLTLAAEQLGLGPSVIATVNTLLSCLPPKREHDVVFASNATLVLRRNGISDRTLRRHIAELVAAGLLVRVDSPNGKRYSKRDTNSGTALRFGLNLAPLFAAYGTLQGIADHHRREIERLAYLRTKIRALLADIDLPAHIAAEARHLLRRKVSVDTLERCIETLEIIRADAITNIVETTLTDNELSGRHGQNVRHQQKSGKEIIEEDTATTEQRAEHGNGISLHSLTAACPEATSFLPTPLTSTNDVISHARRLAPMLGIDDHCYEAAVHNLGHLGTALSIWGLLERQTNIMRFGAYFRSVTSGRHLASFNPFDLIERLIRQNRARELSCPRTI